MVGSEQPGNMELHVTSLPPPRILRSKSNGNVGGERRSAYTEHWLTVAVPDQVNAMLDRFLWLAPICG